MLPINQHKLYIFLLLQVSAHYNTDPYKMLDQLKKMNLKHVKVAYGVSKKNNTATGKEDEIKVLDEPSNKVP